MHSFWRAIRQVLDHHTVDRLQRIGRIRQLAGVGCMPPFPKMPSSSSSCGFLSAMFVLLQNVLPPQARFDVANQVVMYAISIWPYYSQRRFQRLGFSSSFVIKPTLHLVKPLPIGIRHDLVDKEKKRIAQIVIPISVFRLQQRKTRLVALVRQQVVCASVPVPKYGDIIYVRPALRLASRQQHAVLINV